MNGLCVCGHTYFEHQNRGICTHIDGDPEREMPCDCPLYEWQGDD